MCVHWQLYFILRIQDWSMRQRPLCPSLWVTDVCYISGHICRAGWCTYTDSFTSFSGSKTGLWGSVHFVLHCVWLMYVIRSRTTLKFWSATMLGAAARNFGPVHKFELPTVIADSVPRATRVFSLASVGHVTGHMVCHMVPIARCRPPYWKIFTVNNLATVF